MSFVEKQSLADGSRARSVRVWVPGRPRTKGSLKPMHKRGTNGARCRVWLTEDGDFSVPWKKRMIDWIRASCVCERYAGAVEVHAFFRFEREDGQDTPWPTGHQYGDEDKLRRNLLDALTQSALLADDALVVGGQTWKRFCRPIADDAGGGFEEPGVSFVVLPAREQSALTLAERWALGDVA